MTEGNGRGPQLAPVSLAHRKRKRKKLGAEKVSNERPEPKE